jgi:DNA-binding NtrC family response regulator
MSDLCFPGAESTSQAAQPMVLIAVGEGDERWPLLESLSAQDGVVLRVAATVEEAARLSRAVRPAAFLIDETIVTSELVAHLAIEGGASVYVVVAEYSPRAMSLVVQTQASSAVARDSPAEDFLRLASQDRDRHLPRARGPSQIGTLAFVGESPPIKEVCRLIALSAPSTASVLVTGESGTGKEVVARAIHRFSPRRHGPFIALNCCAIPENLLESELFGHEKGAFTGADVRRKGRFEEADGGTLFLDEIGDLPPSTQVKLLRVLQERSFERVGSSESIAVNVRLITATNRELDDEVAQGRFRADLYYRLNVFHIVVPPLRERSGDVSLLWDYFVKSWAVEESRAPRSTDPKVKAFLEQHRWPGNIRELANLARRTVALRAAPMITPGALPRLYREPDRPRDEPPPDHEATELVGVPLEELEREAILRTYEAFKSVKRTAEALRISERKLYYRLKEYRDQGWLEDEEPEL